MFFFEALIILSVGFCLLRILGKKTVSEMTGLELITMLSMASVTGHAVSEDGLGRTIITLCLFVALLITIQYLAIKFNFIENIIIGKATPVIKEGQLDPVNLKRLRMSVDQLEARMREKGISSMEDIKWGTIEISGELGYELTSKSKPLTVEELEKLLAQYGLVKPSKAKPKNDLFQEVFQYHEPDKKEADSIHLE
ncbi:DUF421 domain-containing protein [Paenibacillus profundus]|uniref:DUF421 domain-containing protein n=1 Tax=Paenibacillus profundus TaxID=1173085 RepID=UPI001F46E52D|nr:YetF domain-containing protein [Paenibacillus profundus]